VQAVEAMAVLLETLALVVVALVVLGVAPLVVVEQVVVGNNYTMIKDFLISFKDNISKKTSNPILGTYAIVWILRNWKVVYTFFYFESTVTLADRIEKLSSFFTMKSFVIDLFINIFFAIGLLVLTYTLISISRLIVNLFDKKLTPWIYKISDFDSLVTKDYYDKVRKERNELELKLGREQETKGKLHREISQLEDQLQEYFSAASEREAIEDGEENKDVKSNQNDILADEESNVLFEKIKSKNLGGKYLETVLSIQKGQGWLYRDDNDIKYFTKLGLLDYLESDSQDNSIKYNVSKTGENVLRRTRLDLI
jgi:hypothetical protein